MTSSGQTGRIFVGREREMAELMAFLDSSMAGQGRLVMLAGEPGIGKTRTATELASKAQERGAQVYWGWCYEGEGAPPYWPWIQSIRSYVRSATATQLESEMGSNAATIATLLPEVHEKLPGLMTPPELEPEQARFRLFDSIAAFLKNASATTPLVIVLEDLHWADRSSLMLCEFISREISDARVMLLGTYRDVEVDRNHPLSQTLGALIREPNFGRVQLGGLEPSDVGRFVELSVGVTLTQPDLEMVHTRTEGNPLFLNELVRLLDDEDAAASGDWTTSLPQGVRDVIGRRLHRLSEKCNEILTVAAVVGREFTLGQLTPLMDDLDEQHVLGVLDEALSARIIEEFPRIIGRYRFSHSLIQETLVEELTTNRRVRLHARIAEALEQLYAEELEEHAAEMAHHFFQAQTLLGAGKLALYSLMAGEGALGSYAWEEAGPHFARGLEAKQVSLTGLEPATDLESARLLFGFGRVQSAMLPRSRLHEATTTLRRAFDYFANSGDVANAVAVAEQSLPPMTGQRTEMPEIVRRALKLVSPNSHDSARLWSSYGRWVGIEQANYQDSKAAFESALFLARRLGDVDLEMKTYSSIAQVEAFHLHLQDCLANSLKSTELISKVDNPVAEVVATWFVAFSMVTLGETAHVDRALDASLETAERLREHYWLGVAYWGYASLSLLRGDWDECLRYCERGLDVAADLHSFLVPKAIMEYQRGDLESGDDTLMAIMDFTKDSIPGPSLAYLAPATAFPISTYISSSQKWLNQFDMVEERAREALASATCTPFTAIFARCGLGLIAVQRNDASTATEMYRDLLPHRGTIPMTGHIAIDRLLGLLAHTFGELEAAAGHFEDSLDFCRKAGYRPELAWTGADYADALLDRNGPGDQEKAATLLDQSLVLATELAMRPLMEKVATVQRQMDADQTAPSHPDGLTEREVDVLRLIASGKTNQEIGDELYISARTVANHAANIFSKTGAANRAEAATYASRNGLV
ncbi:MAG: AAA family ATPase [Chloroflexi bacterium]|nr:AAA family ATPase [Chloroflexota bacterium]